ncbi:MAG: PAS domain-containing protein [Syntrophaceae bacterium]|jgi:two-component system sensor histidine kinase HydH|nr:PAS domain-containing protein [Syntrophaceae bacterium]
MQQKKKTKARRRVSVWLAGSAIIVLAGILGLMMVMQFSQRKTQAVTLFIEKGATLISSFEAGLSCRLRHEEALFDFQTLLAEVARQPDIDYMIVTDGEGNILADSDPTMLGRSYGLDLDVQKIAASRELRWRQAANPEGADTFEVYRGFSPLAGKGHSLAVFVGFNMEKIEKASREDALQTVMMAIVLVLIGSLAIVALFLVQAYRLAQVSLSRLTVFSEALVKSMPIALLAVDKEGEVVACNEPARPLIVSGCDEATGKKAAAVLRGPFLQILEGLAGQNAPVEKEISVSSADGPDQIWEVAATSFADEDAQEGRMLLARNVTALREMEREVAHSRHLNAIGSLAAGVAHEIRNPLSSIKGFAVYFKQRLAGNAEDEETAQIMIAETDRLNRVISQLIEFARPLQLKKERTCLAELARQTVRLVEAEAAKQTVAVDVRVREPLPDVEVDPDKIKQVLLNLLLNALAAMPGGGKLTVDLAAQGSFLDVAVSDTGEGIRAEDLPRIYDPYFTSKPAGTGLGLAVVQKIMDAHGGRIFVESTRGAGTTVTLRFVLMSDDQGEK